MFSFVMLAFVSVITGETNMFDYILAFQMNGDFNDACFDGYQFLTIDDINLFTSACYAI